MPLDRPTTLLSRGYRLKTGPVGVLGLRLPSGARVEISWRGGSEKMAARSDRSGGMAKED